MNSKGRNHKVKKMRAKLQLHFKVGLRTQRVCVCMPRVAQIVVGMDARMHLVVSIYKIGVQVTEILNYIYIFVSVYFCCSCMHERMDYFWCS